MGLIVDQEQPINPQRRDPSSLQNRSDVGLGKVDNLSSSEILSMMNERVKNETLRSKKYVIDGDGYYQLFKVTDQTCVSFFMNLSSPVGVIESIDAELSLSMDKARYEIKSTSGEVAKNSLLIYKNGVCYLYLNSGTEIITEIELCFYQYNLDTFIETPVEKITDIEEGGQQEISLIQVKESASLTTYKYPGSEEIIEPGTEYQTLGYDYPTINGVPFTGEKDPDWDYKLRNIKIQAQHPGSSREDAGVHDWGVLKDFPIQTLKRNDEGTTEAKSDKSTIDGYGLTRLAGYQQTPGITYEDDQLNFQIKDYFVRNALKCFSKIDGNPESVVTSRMLKTILYPILGYLADQAGSKRKYLYELRYDTWLECDTPVIYTTNNQPVTFDIVGGAKRIFSEVEEFFDTAENVKDLDIWEMYQSSGFFEFSRPIDSIQLKTRSDNKKCLRITVSGEGDFTIKSPGENVLGVENSLIPYTIKIINKTNEDPDVKYGYCIGNIDDFEEDIEEWANQIETKFIQDGGVFYVDLPSSSGETSLNFQRIVRVKRQNGVNIPILESDREYLSFYPESFERFRIGQEDITIPGMGSEITCLYSAPPAEGYGTVEILSWTENPGYTNRYFPISFKTNTGDRFSILIKQSHISPETFFPAKKNYESLANGDIVSFRIRSSASILNLVKISETPWAVTRITRIRPRVGEELSTFNVSTTLEKNYGTQSRQLSFWITDGISKAKFKITQQGTKATWIVDNFDDSVTPHYLFRPEGEKETITIKSVGTWGIDFDNTQWLKVYNGSQEITRETLLGIQDQESTYNLTLVAKANIDPSGVYVPTPRETDLVLRSGDNSKTIHITQSGFEEGYVSINPGSLLFDGISEKTCQITSNGEYKLKASHPWISLSQNIGGRVGEITTDWIRVSTNSLNPLADNRTGSITVLSATTNKVLGIIEVSQTGNFVLDLSTDHVTSGVFGGNTNSITVSTNSEGWSIRGIEGYQWITTDRTSGVNNDSVVFTILPNTKIEEEDGSLLIKDRTAQIEFYSVLGDTSKTKILTITQYGSTHVSREYTATDDDIIVTYNPTLPGHEDSIIYNARVNYTVTDKVESTIINETREIIPVTDLGTCELQSGGSTVTGAIFSCNQGQITVSGFQSNLSNIDIEYITKLKIELIDGVIKTIPDKNFIHEGAISIYSEDSPTPPQYRGDSGEIVGVTSFYISGLISPYTSENIKIEFNSALSTEPVVRWTSGLSLGSPSIQVNPITQKTTVTARMSVSNPVYTDTSGESITITTNKGDINIGVQIIGIRITDQNFYIKVGDNQYLDQTGGITDSSGKGTFTHDTDGYIRSVGAGGSLLDSDFIVGIKDNDKYIFSFPQENPDEYLIINSEKLHTISIDYATRFTIEI